MPTRDVARPDATSYREALEVATLGSRSPELAGWKVVRETKHGSFTLRELSNPASPAVTYDFVDHIDAESADVRIVQGASEVTCSFTKSAAVESGGLGGTPTYPAARFTCPGQPSHVFVGVTIIEDDKFRPRRCIWSHPPAAGEMVTRFKNVPLGTELRGHTGMRWVIVRDGVNPGDDAGDGRRRRGRARGTRQGRILEGIRDAARSVGASHGRRRVSRERGARWVAHVLRGGLEVMSPYSSRLYSHHRPACPICRIDASLVNR